MKRNSYFLPNAPYCIVILLLFGCVPFTGADIAEHNFPEVQTSEVVLIPGHIGDDYSFTGDYGNGQVTINGPGVYCLSRNLTTESTDYAVQVNSPHVTLDGNGTALTGPGVDGYGVSITSNGSYAFVKNVSSVSGFYKGIYSEGDHVIISDSLVHDNKAVGINTYGNYSVIERNSVFNHSDVGIYSWGHYSDITGNYASFNRNGILSQGNYANISGNAGNENVNYGIYAGGVYVGPEPGDEGHGYYPRVINNVAILNSVGGIKSAFPHAVIRENSVFQNLNNGITTTGWSNNTTISENYVSDNPIGIVISDLAQNVSITQNLIRSDGNSGIYINSGNGTGYGAIYDNYLSNEVHVNGTGKIGAFSWTNPAGPVPGSNIMDGPFIAGNYWSNADKTGWSDKQPANSKGYAPNPYEIAPGVYDTAPLVKLQVSPTPTPVMLVANFTADQVTGVPPLFVQFTDISSGVPTKWKWNFGDGTYSTLRNPVHEYKGIGRYTVTLEVENRDVSSIVRKTEFVKTIRLQR